MLRLLLCLASVHLVAGVITLSVDRNLSITECPVTFYGKKYETLFFHYSTNVKRQNYCFDKVGDYNAGDAGDCILLPPSSNSPTFEIIMDMSTLSAEISALRGRFSDFSSLQPVCALAFSMSHASATKFYIISFGDVSALHLSITVSSSGMIINLVEGNTQDSKSLSTNQLTTVLMDLRGCRKPPDSTTFGRAAKPGEVTEFTFDGCLEEFCTKDGTPANRTTCQNGAVCQKNLCVVRSICAVAGNTIIDHKEQSAPILDFCGHKLLSNQEIEISAYYAERRLSDVPLLDNVLLTTAGGNLTLDQGGRIFNDTGFHFTPTEGGTEAQGLGLTKVQGGVLVKYLSPSNASFEVFFDGTTLHMASTIPEDKVSSLPETGMCANVTVNVPAPGNPANCALVVSDPAGTGLDCDAVKERCNFLLKEPFSDCSVDPGPYITACTNLLCNYTDGDGLFCHLLDAYARSCQLQNWRDTVGCSVSECYYKRCVYDNEFCGLSVGGEARCLCRSSYAAPFRANNKLGDDTVCASKTASVTLVGCLLEEKGVNISSLHLNDPSCTGVKNPATNEVTFSFSDSDNCAANVSINGSRLIYTNTITSPENTGGVITRDDQLSIEFSCAYHQPQVQTMSLKIKDSSVVKVIDAGEWTYVFNMTAFTNPAMTSAVASSTALRLDQPLWVKTEAAEVDATQLALVIDSCWATEENNANAAQKYYLIKNGCSDEDSVEVISNGQSLASTFSFRVFQFVGSDGDVYLHCDTKLCIKSTGCTKSCGAPP